MAHSVRYPTEATFKGPWWLTLNALEELEGLASTEWDRWQAAEEARVLALNQYQAANDPERPLRKLAVQLKDGRSVELTSFAAADRLPDLQTSRPVAFSLTMRRGGRRWRIELKHRWNELEVEASPPDAEGAEFVNSIRRWRDTHGPSALRSGLASGPWQVLIIGVIALLLLVTQGTTRGPTVEQDERAAALLSDGLSPDEVRAAVALLLESQFTPRRVQPPPGLRPSLLLLGMALIAFEFVWPTSMLGVGRGRRALQTWKTLDRLTFIGVPTALLAAMRPVFEAHVRSVFGL